MWNRARLLKGTKWLRLPGPAVGRIQSRFVSFESLGYGVAQSCKEPSHDTGCTFCEPQFPPDLPINYDVDLYGSIGPIYKHLVVCSGTSDWPKRVELTPGSVISTMSGLKRKTLDPIAPVSITAIDAPSEEGTNSAYLYPDNLYIQNIPDSESSITEFMKLFLKPEQNYSTDFPGMDAEGINELKKKYSPKHINSSGMVLICSHMSRDARCGIAGPMIRAELENVLREKNLLWSEDNPQGIRVVLGSHLSGHMFAGNIIYFDEVGTGIWYGRVKPSHVQGIVEQTIEKKTIIKELLRGIQYK